MVWCGKSMAKTSPMTFLHVPRFSAETREKSLIWTRWNISWGTTVSLCSEILQKCCFNVPALISFFWRFLCRSSVTLDYRKDPYSKKHPCKSICCRNDLRLRRPHPGGCYDTKVQKYVVLVYSGYISASLKRDSNGGCMHYRLQIIAWPRCLQPKL